MAGPALALLRAHGDGNARPPALVGAAAGLAFGAVDTLSLVWLGALFEMGAAT
jgi:hypothetical protein